MNPYTYSKGQSKRGRRAAAAKSSLSAWSKAIFLTPLSPAIALAFVLFAAGSVAGMTALAYPELSQGAQVPVAHKVAYKPEMRVLGDSISAFYPYPSGSLVNDSGTVYFISGTSKVPFTSSPAFTGLGYSFGNVIQGDLSNYTLVQNYTLNTANMAHPWGSWLIYKGTVYYSTQAGLIGVPSAQVFISNGGTWNLIVRANSYDVAALNSNNNLGILTNSDPRVISVPTYQFSNNANNSTSSQTTNIVPPINVSLTPSTVTSNTAPNFSMPFLQNSGSSQSINVPLSFSFSAIDAQGGLLTAQVGWGDSTSNTLAVNSQANIPAVFTQFSHTYSQGGSYLITITVSDSQGLSTTKTASFITIANSTSASPVLSASPSLISFSSSNIAPATVTLTNTNNTLSTANWTAVSTVSWLALSNGTSGTLSANSSNTSLPLIATANPNGLSVGTYNGQIQITGNFTTVVVPVTLTVTSTINVTAALSASVSSISLSSVTGGSNNFEGFSLTNNYSGSGASYSVSANPSNSWLSVSPSSGTVTANGYQQLVATVNTNLLSSGSHNGSLTINYSFPSGVTNSITIPVTVGIAATTSSSSLSLSQSSFNFSYIPAGVLPVEVNGTVTNTSNNSSITYTQIINNQPAWLSGSYWTGPITISPGQSAGLGVSVDPTKVSGPGTYTTSIVLSGNFVNSPLTIPVTLVVSANNQNTLSVSPSSLNFGMTVGGNYPNSQSIYINPGSSTATWQASAGSGIFNLDLSGGTICGTGITICGTGPASIVVSMSYPYSPATYTSNIQITSGGQTQTIPVTLAVTASTAQVTITSNKYDYNNDGVVNQSDYAILQAVALGAQSCPSGKTCDINGDGQVNVVDLQDLSNMINGVSPSPTLAKNSAFTNQTVNSNQTRVHIGSYTIQATNIEGVRITNLSLTFPAVTGSSVNPATALANLYIVTPQGNATPVNPSSNNNFPVNFTVSANQTATVDVYADIGNASGNIQTALSASGVGVVSNQAATMSSQPGQVINILPASQVVLNAPTLNVSSPLSGFVIGGSTNQSIAAYNFSATGAVSIQQLTFSVMGSGITSVSVGGVSAPVVGGNVTINGLNMPISAGFSGTVIPVTVNYASVGINGVASNQSDSISLTGVKYLSGSTTSNLTASVSSNKMILVESYPTVTLSAPSGASGSGLVIIAKVTVMATPGGNVVLTQLPLIVTSPSSVISGSLTAVDDVTGQSATSNSVALSSGSSLNLAFNSDNTIFAGTSKTYDIYLTPSAQFAGTTVATQLGSSGSFMFNDVSGGASGITGSYIPGYPINTVSAQVTTPYYNSAYDYGNYGVLNQADVQVLTNVALGAQSCPSGKTCDINGDGNVNVVDVQKLINMVNGK